MKNKLFLLLLLPVFVPSKVSSQITLSVDSLILDDVIWICRKDIWIEDFAYGPHLRFVCSITNNSKDTVMIDLKNGVSLEYDPRKHYHKNIFVGFPNNDTILAIPCCSQVQIDGDLFAYFFLKGKHIVRDSYEMVDFFPSIMKLIKKSQVVIQVTDQSPLRAAIRNCFVGRTFFINQTFNESILDIGKNNSP